MNTYNKRAQIFGMSFIPLGIATVRNYPGANVIQVTGEWIGIPVIKGEFKEKIIPGSLIEQELKATITDTGAAYADSLHDLFRQEGLVRLKFTNGAERVVGTDQFPVLMQLEESGTPAAFTLSFKRNSSEPAKILKSF